MMLRKTRALLELPAPAAGASMRPQHDAAENIHYPGPMFLRVIASMRPQHDAAENPSTSVFTELYQIASMRPQHDAAENHRLGTH